MEKALVGEYWETWTTYKCPYPNCYEINWHCDGDLTDFSKSDVEALECWSCGQLFWLNQDDDHDLDIEQSFSQKGQKTP